jgi:hypothetical protein
MEPWLITHQSFEMPFVIGGDGSLAVKAFFFNDKERVWKKHSESIHDRRSYSCGALPLGFKSFVLVLLVLLVLIVLCVLLIFLVLPVLLASFV